MILLDNQMWFDFCDGLEVEIRQCVDEGIDAEQLFGEAERIKKMPRGEERTLAGHRLWKNIRTAGRRKHFPYIEPEQLEEIFKAPAGTDGVIKEEYIVSGMGKEDGNDFYNRIYGAWLGRTAGCLLGKPVEGWKAGKIVQLLKDSGNYPVNIYTNVQDIDCMPEDDDINYTLLALKLIEKNGREFLPEDVALNWLESLPILHVCTAERVAYINFVNGIAPPGSAAYKNPYREYIGAAIRADLYGYICPGNPRSAAKMAYKDAIISHTKNGVYGAMFMAGMTAEALVSTNIAQIIYAGLDQIPQASRLAYKIRDVLEWYHSGMKEEQYYEKLHSIYDETLGYDWCHVIPNLMIVCAGLLYGALNMDKTLGFCLCAGFDTDCNCASAGSVIGAVLGSKNIPDKWKLPLNDTICSGVDGIGKIKISEAAQRTLELIE